MTNYRLLLLLPLLMVLTFCKEEKLNPVNGGESVPSPVKNVQVENLPGAARLSYSIVPKENLLYVEAEWELDNGEVMTAKSSYFNNYLLIEGFGNTRDYSVKLYSVGRNLKRSDPLEITVHPLEPPIQSVLKSLEVKEDFGGFRLDFINSNESEISIHVLSLDSVGDWVPGDIFYTASKEGRLFVRGFDPVERTFGILIKDRWGNQTELFSTKLVPLYEEKLNKDNFREHKLPSDIGPYSGTLLSNLWDGNTTTNAIATPGVFRTADGFGLPHHYTFDLGVTAKLNRYELWQRGAFTPPHTNVFAGGAVRKWEVWGSTNPDPMGSFDGWIKLMDCELIKPSGLPVPENSPEDIEAAQAGHGFTFPSDLPPVRYIRFKITDTWGGTGYSWISELSFYGQTQ